MINLINTEIDKRINFALTRFINLHMLRCSEKNMTATGRPKSAHNEES